MAERGNKKNWISEQACVGIAHTCNLYCVYCQNPPDGVRKDPARVAARLKKDGVKAVSLEGGGEPTAGPDFFLWLKALKSAGVEKFMLSTNGVALADPAFCRKAAESIDYFVVNFPSHRPGVYARVTRSVKFKSALKALRNLKTLGCEGKLRLFHIISGENYRLLPDFATWVAKNFPRIAFVNFTFLRNAGRAESSPGILPRYSLVSPFIRLALARLKRGGVKAVAQNMPLCQLRGFEGFSFEFQRWRRGDKVLEAGVPAPARCEACSRCSLAPACCGARKDYVRVHGAGELAASSKDPFSIKQERF